MHARSFRFDSAHLNAFFSPRKPRTPLLRAVLGVVGLVLLAMLVFFGLFVGAAMLAVGLAWRLLRRSPARPASPTQVVDAEYRVVRKSELPAPR
ncbi:hypothetical protein [Pseudoxanthomonas daejeonensis]|uniref:Transmembrane protein n=1 Tax=Pseudoxanthomonas daejeonensis TaxID=266062 RepID=A0ABQ6Z876_9GAMM|nr:hypothetical protein [Pseudoxanthomonas daejeonensis]KAF1695398.1 hypothetical protein CSC65_06410 [Pseudoxanthomonas daejeonensis]